MVREGDWKLIEWFEDNSIELYNVPDDISEKNNLAESKSEIAKRLHAELVSWRKDVNAIMPTPNPDAK